MNLSLRGKTAVVCGSTQGIGRAIAVELAAAGANCILVARRQEALQSVVSELDRSQGQQHEFRVVDFADGAAVESTAAEIAARQKVEVLINNTGGPSPGPVTDARAEQFTQAFSQHVLNSQALVQAFLPGMKQAGYGRIINIISTSVKIPIANLGVSNTIRAAMAGWSKTLAQEVAASGITVNNILPGYTRTGRLDSLIQANAARQKTAVDELTRRMENQIPARRFGEPEEIAALAAFLAAPAASYINGTNIPVDGGSTGAF